ncbi:MAG: glycosyltransferase [Calditrichaeota bacterium]|nr:glycosyltransferase [Calditrichota bacterium]
MDHKDLTIVIPVWNEENKIEADVRNVSDFLKQTGLSGELLVVDDGSSDGTRQKLRQLRKKYSDILKPIFCETHIGKGHAVRLGMLQSRGQVVMFMDSGGNVPLKYISVGIDLIGKKECHIAAGSRFLRQSVVRFPMTLRRRITSALFRKAVHLYLQLPPSITDSQCGFKIFDGHAAGEIAREARLNGFLTDLEFYFLAAAKGYVWKEFPIEWSCDRDSRLSLLKNFPLILAELKYLKKRFFVSD